MKSTFSKILLVGSALLGLISAQPALAQDAANDGGAGASAQRIAIDTDSFVEGNLYFVAYHELGHALVSEFDLAVVGREEDAVDGLATVLMTPDDQKTPPDYLMGAVKGWFLFASFTKVNEISWWDEHGTSQQRAFNIACLLYGSDPTAFKSVADTVQLPEARRQSCQHDSEMNETSWDALLQEDSYGDNEKPADDLPAPEIIYKPTEKFQAQQDYLKHLELLEDIAAFMHTSYKFKPGIKLVADECGQVNAFWNRGDRQLTVCYELVDAYQNLGKQFTEGSVDEDGNAEPVANEPSTDEPASGEPDSTSNDTSGDDGSGGDDGGSDGQQDQDGSGGGNSMNGG